MVWVEQYAKLSIEDVSSPVGEAALLVDVKGEDVGITDGIDLVDGFSIVCLNKVSEAADAFSNVSNLVRLY